MLTKNRKQEKGVALIFALGILGLMTALALSFASISLTNRDAGKNKSEIRSAKELANSVINRVAYILYSEDFENIKPENAGSYLYSQTNTSPKSFDWIWKLAGRANTLTSALYSVDIPDYSTPAANPTWQYIKTPDNKQVLARFAYVALPEPSAVSIGALLLDEDNNGITGYTRKGISFTGELDPKLLFESLTGVVDPDLSILNSNTPDHHFTAFNDVENFLNDQFAKDKENKRNFVKTFSPYSFKYPEVYIDPKDETKKYHKFNMKEFATAVAQISDQETRKQIVEYLKDAQPTEANDNPTEQTVLPFTVDKGNVNGQGCYWIKNFSYSDVKIEQIIANMMDFFTPLIITDGTNKIATPPTSDIDKEWDVESSNIPTYTGLKNTPYISGVGFEADITLDLVTTYDPITNSYSYKLDVQEPHITKTYLEAIALDSFKGVTNSTLELEMAGNVTFNISVDGLTLTPTTPTPEGEQPPLPTTVRATLTKSAGTHITQIWPTESTSDGPKPIIGRLLIQNDTEFSGKVPGSFSIQEEGTKKDFSESTRTAKNIKISNITFSPNIKLTWKFDYEASSYSVQVDFANLQNSLFNETNTPQNGTFPLTPADASAGTPEGRVTLTIHIAGVKRPSDPRDNLLPARWNNEQLSFNDSPDIKKLFDDMPFGTNVSAASIYNQDDVKYTNPDSPVSGTNYVILEKVPKTYFRAKGFDTTFSPWELSFIHRGSPWETLNFTKYSKNSYKYEDGDLALLEQLKFTDKTYSYGRMNFNTLSSRDAFILQALLKDAKGIPIDTKGDFSQTKTEILNFFTALKTYRDKPDTKPVLNPYEWLEHVTANNIFKDDAELITKILPIFNAEPTYLPRRVYVFAIAQLIEDNREGKISVSGSPYSAGYQMPDNKKNIKGMPSIDTSVNAKQGQYDNLVDKIVGEHRVFAIIERDYTFKRYDKTTKHYPKWKVVKVEDVEK